MTTNTLLQYLDDLPADMPPLAVAVGVFDGVHHGHQALLKAAREVSDGEPAALTFDPHPAAVFAPEAAPKLLCTLEERARRLREHGAVRVLIARFDASFASQSPEEFIRVVLVERLRAKAVVVGEDFRFGRGRAGDVAALKVGGAQHQYDVVAVPPVVVDGVPARSTTIRHLLTEGKIEAAARLLGWFPSLPGVVVTGRQLGRTLGYPTANLAPPPSLLIPGAGVYAGYARLADGRAFRSAISIGTNPTVTDGPDAPRTVEAYLMDGFDGDLYGQPLTLEFVRHLRPTLKFDGLPALVEQMARDATETELLPAPSV